VIAKSEFPKRRVHMVTHPNQSKDVVHTENTQNG